VLSLGEDTSIDALKVYGRSPYRLTLLNAAGETLSGPHDLSALEAGWNTFHLVSPERASEVALRFDLAPGAEAPVAEIELWGTAAPLQQSGEPPALPGSARPPSVVADTLAMTPKRIAFGNTGGGSSCGSFEFELTRHPGVYRRAWLRYRTKGVFRPFALTRTLNNGTGIRGRWVASSEDQTFVQPIDPEQLLLGANRAEFCIPDGAGGDVEISGVELIGELDHGSNLVEAAWIAPFDREPTSGVPELLGASSSAVQIGADQELVLSFDRLIAPDAILLPSLAETAWTIRCVDIRGSTHELHASATDGATPQLALVIDDGGREQCAGLRLRPDANASVTGVRVFGSGSGRRIDFPRIVLASAREHFGLHAWVDGWAHAPASTGGGVRVSIDDRDAGTETGVFGALLTRSLNLGSEGEWPVKLKAQLADGSTFTRVFILDHDGGIIPGGLGTGMDPGDGLTAADRIARYGEVGREASAEVRPNAFAHIALGTHIYLDLPAGAVQGPTTVTIRHRDAAGLPSLDPGMVNVTAPSRHGYEFLPHGQQFHKPIEVNVPYQPNLVPPGYTPEDVNTFYYDEQHKRWEMLPRADLDRQRAITRSLTDHFTTMIDAVVVSPEHPQASSFDPNRLSGLKAAVPTERVQLIAPPEANANGDATLSYALEIPPGRLGVQPSFVLTYNSSGGNDWLGIGWSLSGASSIGIDTRWGVPRYNATVETETYMLEGQQLSPTAHRGAPVARSQATVQIEGKIAKIFRPRVEGSFQRIVRFETDPKQHWWEVTDRKGVRHFYGGTPEGGVDPSACLADDNGNVYRWALREVRDTHGNRIRFDYQQVASGTTPNVPGRELYLQSAHYTLRPGESTAPYRVVFLREGGRPDQIVSGRGGFKQVTVDRLRRIEVYYQQTLVRAWQLTYDQGPFQKSRLRGLSQLGAGDQVFPGNTHRFEYFDEVTQSSGVYNGFDSSHLWSAGLEDPDVGTLLPPELFKLVGPAEPSVLGGSRTREGGPHLYVGFSLAFTKHLSFGGKIGGRFSRSEGRVSLVDIDGDGLPDRVFRAADGKYYFNRNQSGPSGPSRFADVALPVSQLPALSRERSSTFSFGPEAYALGLTFHDNQAFSRMRESTYLNDVNGDGLVDLVDGGSVLFNRLVSGLPAFVDDGGAGTPVPLGASAVAAGALPADLDKLPVDLDTHVPLIDTVRCWEALYAGRVRISGGVQLVKAQRPGADGLRVSIEHEGVQRWTHQFGPGETQAQQPQVNLTVAAGDRVYFRVHALQDGRDDRVRWSPIVEYIDLPPSQDENLLDVRRFDAAADFALTGRPGIGVKSPFSGTMHLSARLKKLRETTDDVEAIIKVDGNVVSFQALAASSTATLSIEQSFQVSAGSYVSLQIHSDSPIDATAITFDEVNTGAAEPRIGPWVYYLTANDQYGQPVSTVDPQGHPSFELPLPYDQTTYSQRSSTLAPSITPGSGQPLHIIANVNVGTISGGGAVTFTAKSGGKLLGKQQVPVIGSGSYTMQLNVQAPPGKPVFFAFSTSTPELYDAISTSASANGSAVPTIKYGVGRSARLPNPYRGWSVGAYNGGSDRGNRPIPPDAFEAAPAFDGSEQIDDEATARELANRFMAEEMLSLGLLPLPDVPPCPYKPEDPIECTPVRGAHWSGPDTQVYVTGQEMGASRLGGLDLQLGTAADLAGARAVPRISSSSDHANGGGAGPLSYSIANGSSQSLLDFLDINGDSFPDVVSTQGVQYTSPRGVLAEQLPSLGDIRETQSASHTEGIGGNPAKNPFGHRAGKGGGKAPTTEQMARIGVVVNYGQSGSQADAKVELMDVNGDGLPDQVRQKGLEIEVALNLGYRYADFEPWGQAYIHHGNTDGHSGGFSINDGIYGFAGGPTASLSQSTIGEKTMPLGRRAGATLLDVNSDGLLDRVEPGVEPDKDSLRIWFNLGHRFASDPVIWRGTIPDRDINENDTTSLALGVYYTVPHLSFVVNPGFDAGESVGRPTTVIRDIDGDGYPDHLASSNSHEVLVARNRTGRTNLLRHIQRPLGAQIGIDYERKGNTQDMPHSRWVLGEVKIHDGQADSAELGQANDYTFQKIRYADGRYDRSEREFYGFEHVTVDTLDTRGWDGATSTASLPVYRRAELTYRNRTYPERGLLAESRLLAGSGAIFKRDVYQHEFRNAITGQVLTPPQIAQTESIFPALVREDHYQHEGDPATAIQTYRTQDYDLYGNVVQLYDAGGPGIGDDYRAQIRYTAESAACRAYHIVGAADRIVVRDGAGTVLRQRESDIECAAGTGNLLEVRTVLDTSNAIARTDLAYEANGNLIRVTAPPNRNGQRYQLDYSYDSHVQTHVAQVADSFGYYSTAEYDLRFGAITRDTDINGNAVVTEYDAFGRPARIIGPYELKHGLPYTILYSYITDAPVPYATTANMDMFRQVADPIETVTFVDGLGRVLQTKKDGTVYRGDEAPAQDVMLVSGRVHHDPWGRVVATYFPREEAKSAAVNLAFTHPADASAPPTRTTYDVIDRVLETRLPDNARTRNDYTLEPALEGGGLWALTRTTDPLDNRHDNYRDARGRIQAVVEYLHGRGITTRYGYDPLDQIRRVTDAAGNLTSVGYDLAGRRTDVTHPDSGHTEMVYDAAGNVIRKTTANLRPSGQTIEYRFDFTHLVAIDYPTFHDNNVTYTWGSAALLGQEGNRVGRITLVKDHSGSEQRSYGKLGEIVRETRSINSHTMGQSDNSPEVYTTQYLYDTWGRLQQMVYPDTEVLTYRYDAGGQVRDSVGVKLGTVFPYLRRLEYDRFEQRVFMQTGNGIRSHYTYDPRRRWLDSLDAGDFQRLRYTFDLVGNVKTLQNDLTGVRPNEYGGRVEQSFTYDDLYRLTDASGSWLDPPGFRNQYSYSLTYSDIHNILRKNQQHWIRKGIGNDNGPDVPQHKTTYDSTYAYGSSKPHAATHIGDRTFSYDPNGNQSGWDHDRNGTRRTIVWDEENRVRSISDNGRTTDFVYDDKGDRVIKTGAQGETVYVNDKWTVRNREIGTKHIFVGTTWIASKLSPGDAHVDPGDHDLLSQMLGRWWEYRSQSGDDHASNTDMNPHYQVPSSMPPGGHPDTNFVYFYHKDHIGSTSYTTDSYGELYSHVQYFPSGELWVDQRSNTERLPYLFSDKEMDKETELYYFGARYYDPRTSLWQNTDPEQSEYLDGAGMGGVYNPLNLTSYAYGGDNPLIFTDPDGRKFAIDPGVKADFDQARAYWKSYKMDWIFKRLDRTSEIINIKRYDSDNDGYSHDNSKSRLLSWNPRNGLRLGPGRLQSSALGLLHELGHALIDHDDKLRNKIIHQGEAGFPEDIRYYEGLIKKADSYLSAAQVHEFAEAEAKKEKYVIEVIEGGAAERAGEPRRHTHFGNNEEVPNVTYFENSP
jgi:RHS repeat-associated protein